MRQIDIDDVLGRLGNPADPAPVIPYGPPRAPAPRGADLHARRPRLPKEVAPAPVIVLDEVSSSTSEDDLKILLVEDDRPEAHRVVQMLEEVEGLRFEVVHAWRAADVRPVLAGHRAIECALLDLSLADAQGLSALVALQQAAPALPIVVLADGDTVGLALEALGRGAQDHLIKERVDGELLVRSMRYAIERKRLEVELARRASLRSRS